MFQVNPIAHLLGQVVPLILILHHRLAALVVVLFDGNFFANVVFRDAQFFLYLQLNGQAMGIPSAFTLYLISLKRFESAKNIFHGAGHHVVNTRCTVGRWRALVKRKGLRAFAQAHALLEDVFLLPKFKNLTRQCGRMSVFILLVLSWHA